MSKKLLAILTILSVIIFWSLTKKSAENVQNQKTQTPLPSEKEENLIDLNFQDQKYKMAVLETSPEKIKLIENFQTKKNSEDIKNEKNCSALTNAGFYTVESTPVGLFKTEEKTYRNYSNNLLFNGVFVISNDNLASINDSFFDQNVKIALQSGPILKSNNLIRKLAINNDKKARRVILGISNPNKIYLFVIFDMQSAYLGPTLSDLPAVLSQIENDQNINLSDAINLDGGTASAFYSDGVTLSELSPIGSAFCIK